jgi:hypothetical protein
MCSNINLVSRFRDLLIIQGIHHEKCAFTGAFFMVDSGFERLP